VPEQGWSLPYFFYQQCLEEMNNINKKQVILAVIQLGLEKILDQVLQATWAESRGLMFHQSFK